MTDNDIIKALECCSKHSGNSCSRCPYHEYGELCIETRNTDIVDFINRQQAEIEEKANKLREVLPIVAELKAEAIKEFAERVKMAFYYEFDELIPSIMADKIDELVKELTEKGGVSDA